MNRFVKVNLLLLIVSFVLFAQPNTSTKFKFLLNSGGNNHLIIIPTNVIPKVKQNANAPLTDISRGDEIGVFFRNGAGQYTCAGATTWETAGLVTSIIAWGNVDQGSVKTGFQEEDDIYFKIYVAKTGYESFADVTLSFPPDVYGNYNPNKFAGNRVSWVTSFGATANPPVIDVEELPIPETYTLSQNYPNPFNPTTKISYTLPRSSYVTLTIFDLNGKEITKLLNNTVSNMGTNYVEWNGKNARGISASSGVYFYKIEARSMETGKTDFLQVKSMLLMK